MMHICAQVTIVRTCDKNGKWLKCTLNITAKSAGTKFGTQIAG